MTCEGKSDHESRIHALSETVDQNHKRIDFLLDFLSSIQRRVEAIHTISITKLDSPTIQRDTLALSAIKVIAMIAIDIMADISTELDDEEDEIPF